MRSPAPALAAKELRTPWGRPAGRVSEQEGTGDAGAGAGGGGRGPEPVRGASPRPRLTCRASGLAQASLSWTVGVKMRTRRELCESPRAQKSLRNRGFVSIRAA